MALVLHPEDNANSSGFVLPSIHSHQEAFHEFSIHVSNASRSNGSISETCLNVRKVVRRIWQGKESDWRWLPSQAIRNECASTSVALNHPRDFAIHTRRLVKHFNNVWKLSRTTPYSRYKFPGLFERRQDGPKSPLLKDFQLARYFRKTHHSFPGFFEDPDTTLGDSEVGHYTPSTFAHKEFYPAMVPLPTRPLSEQSGKLRKMEDRCQVLGDIHEEHPYPGRVLLESFPSMPKTCGDANRRRLSSPIRELRTQSEQKPGPPDDLRPRWID